MWTFRFLSGSQDANSVKRDYRHIGIHPIAGNLGAEVSGVQLNEELNSDVVKEIRWAIIDHLVLVFRDQKLTAAQQLRFARTLGIVAKPHEFVAGVDGFGEVMKIHKLATDKYNFAGDWHYDQIFRESPPAFSVLYAVKVPEYGGDTIFSSQFRAYETLPPDLKERLDGIGATHSPRQAYSADGLFHTEDFKNGHSGTAIGNPQDGNITVKHPAIRTHPESGRRGLFFDKPHTIYFDGMSPEETDALLDKLILHATRPDFTCRVRWQVGTTLIYDNRCLLHAALNDYAGVERLIHRVSIEGDRPR